MKKITLLLVCAVLCATNMMGQTIKVGSQAEGGTWTGPDGLYHATQAVKALQDANSTEVWRDSIYVSGTITRPGTFVFNTWGKDRRFIIVGEGMENTTIQSYTDAELAAYEADPGNNPLPAWKPAHATALAFYIAPNSAADVNNKFKVEVQFHDLTINNIWLPDQSQGKGRSAIRVGQHAAAEFHNVKIANCKNPGNDGSAIEGQHSASLVLENCILENNEGKTGTSIFFWTNKESINSSVTISNTVIRDNESLKKAGGVSFWCPKASSNMAIQINNSTFYNNSSVTASSALEINGAGIDISLYNNTFAYNKGGDSGVGCNWEAPEKVTMINTLIYGSTGNQGQSVNDFGIMLDPDTEDPIFTPGDGTTTFALFNSAIGNTDIDFTGLPTHATSYFNDVLNGWTMGLTETISGNNEVVPAAGSVAIDNGFPFPPYTDGFYGANPDIGSYEKNPNFDPILTPVAPTALTLSPETGTATTLSWTDNSDNEDGFTVYQDGTEIATTAAGVLTYDVSGLDDATEYSFSVDAYNTAGKSGAVAAVFNPPPFEGLLVKKTSSLPMIDGVVDPIWAEVDANVMAKGADGIDAADYAATFKVLWSGNDTANDSLYFLIELTDDKFVSDYHATSGTDRGSDDGLDVFFNPGLAGLANETVDPYRVGIVTDENNENPEFWFTVDQNETNTVTENMHKAHTINGTKYVFEFAIGLRDFDAIGTTEAGYEFGVDFRYNDDDANIPDTNNPGTTKKDGQYSWTKSSSTWNAYGGLGDAMLSDEEVSAPLSVNDIGDIKNLNMYPNPAKDYFVIQTADLNLENARIEVFSLTGQKILVQQITPTQSNVEVNISSLTKGLYLVRLISNDSNFVAKLIVD